jgi:pimeloyl-ACP methyl ester carboxylesterase
MRQTHDASAANWRDTQRDLARTTRTCAYDRAGLGSSVGRHGMQDTSDEIRDLQQLLLSAHIPPPYVLAGHSYGGLLTRLYADAHPRDVAGLVPRVVAAALRAVVGAARGKTRLPPCALLLHGPGVRCLSG